MHEYHAVAAQVLPALVLAALFSEGRIPLQERAAQRDSAWLLLQFMLLAVLGEAVALRVIARPEDVPAHGWETVLVTVSLVAGSAALLVPIALELLRQLQEQYSGPVRTGLERCVFVVEEAARLARWLPAAVGIAAFEPVLRQHSTVAKALGFLAYAAVLLLSYRRLYLAVPRPPGAAARRHAVLAVLAPLVLAVAATPLYLWMLEARLGGRPVATVAWTAYEAALLLPLIGAAWLARSQLGAKRWRFVGGLSALILVVDVVVSYRFPDLGATALVRDASAGTAVATLFNMLWWLPALVLYDYARPPVPGPDDTAADGPSPDLLPRQPGPDAAPAEGAPA